MIKLFEHRFVIENTLNIKYDIEDTVKNVLKKFFYNIPDIEVKVYNSEAIITFRLDALDTKSFTPSILKSELKKFGKVSQSRFKHPRLTQGTTEFRYDIEFIGENND